MEWLKNRKNRLLVSIFAAMAVAMLVAGGTGIWAWKQAAGLVGYNVPEVLFCRKQRRGAPKDRLLACRSAGLVI